MGIEFVLISTNANGMKVPLDARCCICQLLLDDGVGLSGCKHNACYNCMKNSIALCPLDDIPYQVNRHRQLHHSVEKWLQGLRLKCRWFDGFACTATSIKFNHFHHHEVVCANNPKRKLTREQKQAVEMVKQWMKNGQLKRNDSKEESSSSGSEPKNQPQAVHEKHVKRRKSKFGFHSGVRDNPFRSSIGASNPDDDYNWRK